jgi:spermidine synthase
VALKSSKKSNVARNLSVEVSESGGVRSLHLGGDAIQSRILLSAPEALALHYTQAMMGFLLLHAAPREILMIGLGGGSIARFVHHRLDTMRITTVEINPQVVAAARAHFGLPQEDERHKIVVDDGADYVPAHPMSCDVLIVDAFEDGESAAGLCTRGFYDSAYAALLDDGVMVQNFMADEPKFAVYLNRIEAAFDGRVLCMPTGDRVNMMVFAMKCDARRVAIEGLKKTAVRLQRRLGVPFTRMVSDMLTANERTASYLKLNALND